MAYFNSELGKIYYEEKGKGDRILLMIHGNTYSSEIFTPYVKYFQKDFKLIIPDLPGHGKSERLENFPLNYYQKCAQILTGFLQEKNLENVSLFGTSGGAIISMIMASNDRNRISRIVANSFPGKKLSNGKLDLVIHELKRRRRNIFHRYRWKKQHGKGWGQVVQNQIEFLEKIKYKDDRKVVPHIGKIKSEVLLTGSSRDKLVPRLRPVYRKLHKKYPHFNVQLFYHGSDPNRLPGKSGFRNAILEFLK